MVLGCHVAHEWAFTIRDRFGTCSRIPQWSDPYAPLLLSASSCTLGNYLAMPLPARCYSRNANANRRSSISAIPWCLELSPTRSCSPFWLEYTRASSFLGLPWAKRNSPLGLFSCLLCSVQSILLTSEGHLNLLRAGLDSGFPMLDRLLSFTSSLDYPLCLWLVVLLQHLAARSPLAECFFRCGWWGLEPGLLTSHPGPAVSWLNSSGSTSCFFQNWGCLRWFDYRHLSRPQSSRHLYVRSFSSYSWFLDES